MATEDRSTFGIAHPTVVPLNFEPAAQSSPSREGSDRDDDAPPDAKTDGRTA